MNTKNTKTENCFFCNEPLTSSEYSCYIVDCNENAGQGHPIEPPFCDKCREEDDDDEGIPCMGCGQMNCTRNGRCVE